MTQLGTQGVTVELPPGFEGRAVRRAIGPDESVGGARAQAGAGAATSARTNVVLHASTVPLPAEVGDFGSNAVDSLGPDDVFLAVFEYGAEAVGTQLFSQQGIPRSLDPAAFSPNILQRSIGGQSGAQQFFTESGRAFCMYAVLGSDARVPVLVRKVNALLATLHIEPPGSASTEPEGAPHEAPPATSLGTIVELIAAQADLRTLADLLDTSPPVTLAAGTGPFTVFAPSDDAFATVDLAALRADEARLQHVLEYHIVDGDRHSDTLDIGHQLPTLAGPRVTIGRNGAAITVDDATVLRPDLDASNGVVHVIDRVLEPPQ